MDPLLYFNGLERTELGLPEKALQRYYAHHDLDMTHGELPWHDASFGDILQQKTKQAEAILRICGKILIVGASAGGSMAVNVFHEILNHDEDAEVEVITLNAWLQIEDASLLHNAALRRENKRASLAFLDSVVHCEEVATANLSESNKRQIITVQAKEDELVPINTMRIPNTRSYSIPTKHHLSGIGVGVVRVPTIRKQFKS